MLKLKDFFYLQRNDRQAILVLCGVIIVCITLIITVGKVSPSADGDKSDTISSKDSPTDGNSRLRNDVSEQKPLYYKMDGIPHALFPFDPNTADSTQLLKLGLQAWQVRSIYKYRAKGGIFRKPSDFARLYGLTKRQYEVLAPYIIIGEDYRPAADYYGEEKDKEKAPTEKTVYSYPQKLKPGQHVEANAADTTELMKIPGIGSYYAKAVLRYREQLGGFTSVAQLREIEDFPEPALSYLHVNPNEARKISINKLTLNQLRKHPYINFYQAKEICDYRRLHGPIKSLEELKLLKDFPPAEIERLSPYIDFQ